MKKLIPSLAFAGFMAAVVGTSFAAPAAQPTVDRYAAYTGETAGVISPEQSYVIHLECGDYVLHLEWSATDAPAQAAVAADALFDK